jgi:predicted alpha/beta-hydrolase family hydrolase
MKNPEQLTVDVSGSDRVTAYVYPAAPSHRVGVTLVLGHGAGADQLSGFMQLFARGLAARGLDAMTFNFVYMEQRRHVPDQKAKLEGCYRAVIGSALTHRKLKKNRLVIGGKSMGGRIATQVAAADAAQIDGVVCLGYPLHPPGNPAKLRVEHLQDIPVPVLFVQGTRDAFGTPDEIRPFIRKLRATIYPIDGGDHSFKVPKSAGVTQQQVFDAVMDEIASWVAAIY